MNWTSFTFAALVALSACGSGGGRPGPEVPLAQGADGELVVSGIIVRDLESRSDNADLVPAAGAHVRIELRSYFGEDDAPAPLMLEADLPLVGLPMEFSLLGDPEIVFAESETAFLEVRVFNHPGTELRTGDLISETFNSVTRSTGSITIGVRGLEPCDAPNAGGVCI